VGIAAAVERRLRTIMGCEEQHGTPAETKSDAECAARSNEVNDGWRSRCSGVESVEFCLELCSIALVEVDVAVRVRSQAHIRDDTRRSFQNAMSDPNAGWITPLRRWRFRLRPHAPRARSLLPIRLPLIWRDRARRPINARTQGSTSQEYTPPPHLPRARYR
jgi:hypothetical protein